MTANASKAHNRGRGAAAQFLRDNISYDGPGCLIWPFSRQPSGYGALGYNGKQCYAHRLMCEMVKGPAPTTRHEAAHSCGRGRDGCVDPRHLDWKTPTENALDCAGHGTQSRNRWGNAGKLTRRQVAEIWALKGRETQAETGKRFDVSASTIRDVYLGRTHLGYTAVSMLRTLSELDLSMFPNYSNGAWSRANLEAMIDDLVAATNESGVFGQSERQEDRT